MSRAPRPARQDVPAEPARRRSTPEPLIRPATDRDAVQVAALMARSPLLRRYGATDAAGRRAVRRGMAAGDRLVVATAPRGRLLGVAWVVPSRAFTGTSYLRLLLVAESRQRAGVGAALLVAAEQAARAVSNHLALLTTTGNVDARRFYRRHGYRHVGDLPGLARPELDEALYWKTLRPHGERLPV